MFSLNIVAIHFALWVVRDMGGSDAHYGYANAVSMALVLITAPILGAASDQTQRRIPFLIATTSFCVLFTLLLGIGGLMVSLLIFVVANYMFQSGLIFYDALLPLVSTEANRGRVGSFGVSLGYVGSLIGVASGLFLLEYVGHVGMFKVTAFLFLIFSIPCFIFVREGPTAPLEVGWRTIASALSQIKLSIARTRKFPGLSRFLLGRIFYADAVNTLMIFTGIYVTTELGFTDREAQMVLLVAIISSIFSAIFWGFVVDRIGPAKSLILVLKLWMLTIGGVSAIAIFSMPEDLFWVMACLAGIALAGTWCSDRPLLLRLVPEENAGEFFGLYNMVGRFASILGPLMWVAVADTLALGRPAAVLSLLLLIMLSHLILRRVKDEPRQQDTEQKPASIS